LDEWVVRANNSFGQKKLLRDELLADGTVNPNQKLIRNTVRPSMMKATLLKQVDDYYDAGKLDSKATIKDSIRVVASDAAPGRVEIGIDLRVIDWLDQTTMRLAEVSPG
jgi:phage tail sheath gpL-like